MVQSVKQKRRVLYIESNKDGTVGGSYYSLLYLIQGLDKEKYDPYILFCQDNDLVDEFKKVTPHVYIIDYGPSTSARAVSLIAKIKWPYRLLSEILFKQIKLHKIIKDFQIDMVHLNNGYCTAHEWMLAGYLHNVKVVCHDRGTRPPSSFRTKIFIRFVDAVICVSDSYKNNLINDKLKVKHLYRVYNGMLPGKRNDQTELGESDEVRKLFGLENTKNIIGIVGNIDRWKGQHVVLASLLKVKEKYPDIKCLIIGPVCHGAEKYKEELDLFVSNNNLINNVVFTGYQKNIHAILDVLNILVHASIEPEPFGRVILEGMAHAMPIVATNSGGTPEQIENNVTGILVPMDDPDSMANAILYFLDDMIRAKEMGEKGKERLLKLFSIKQMVQGVEDVYEKVFT